jgi:hypothetical protein
LHKEHLDGNIKFSSVYRRCLCQFNGAPFELTVSEKGCCVITVIDYDEVIESNSIEALFTAAINTEVSVPHSHRSKHMTAK